MKGTRGDQITVQTGLTASPASHGEHAVPEVCDTRGPRRRRAIVGTVVVVVVAAAAAALAVTDPLRARPSSPAVGGGSYHTATKTVKSQSLTSQIPVNGTLGYAGSYSVVNQAQGTITALPSIGQVVRQGQVMYRVTNAPVILLYGRVPASRSLSEGLIGPDVAELNADLVRLGYTTWANLGTDTDYYSWATAYAVEQLQAHLGTTVNGSLALGQAVFLPSAVVITGYGQGTVPGGTVMAGSVLLTASSERPVVTINLDAAQEGEVKRGEHVSITLPDGASTPGVVSSVSSIATSSGSSSPPTIAVQVSLTDPEAAANLSQAPVQVTITTGSVSNALVVPVDALLAQPSGQYAVEVIGAGGRHYEVTVTTGLFDDAAGLVQVTGAGLAAGQQVVVPRS